MAQKRKDKAKKRVVVVEAVGEAHIQATFNNIIISLTNTQGQVVSWASAGKWVSEVQKRIRHTQARWRQQTVLRKLMKWV